MKTVKEVSQELGVSDVTIYAHLKKNVDKLKSDVVKIKGVTHIKDRGVNTLKVSLGIIEVPEVKENISLDKVIEEISLNVSNDIREELKEIREQNKLLIQMLQEKENKTLLDKLKDLFR